MDGGVGKKGPVTSSQVARLAGVSQSAVSRSFTPGASIAPKTRAKVLEAAKALGISARTLWGLTTPRGPIPCLRIGHGKRQTVLYPVADLQAWLTRQAEAEKGIEQ